MEVHHHDVDSTDRGAEHDGGLAAGLGIVAAVLGVVITMGALGGPPEEIGQKVAAALVGTFLGILLCYGFVGPLASNMAKVAEDEQRLLSRAARSDDFLHQRESRPSWRSRLRGAPFPGTCGRPSRKWKRSCRTAAALGSRAGQAAGSSAVKRESADWTSKRPIIIIKKEGGHGGHHGGAWKVAYADFVTAMMALFIVLWLMNSSKQIQEAVGGYFKDPTGTSKKVGTQPDRVGRKLHHHQRQHAKAEGGAAKSHPASAPISTS